MAKAAKSTKPKAKKLTAADVPPLREWVTATQIADFLDISRQSVNRMLQTGKFKTLHAIGERRPIFVVKRVEMESFKEERAAKIEAREAKRAEKEES